MAKKEDETKKSYLIVRPNIYPTTFGQRAADTLTKWAGSWTFILLFIFILILWIFTNVYAWINTWDPYPFILLNLFLSCIAAIQAPIILMSQNRANQKDRQLTGKLKKKSSKFKNNSGELKKDYPKEDN